MILYLKNFLSIVLIILVTSCDSNDDSNTQDDNIPQSTQLEDIAQNNPNSPQWVANEDIKSRNGDAMGYGVILNPSSDKLLIFLDGGGACYNQITCSGNLDSYTENDFNIRFSNNNALIISQSSSNQFAGWNFVFVPYATGDVHSGSNTSANVPNGGPSNQEMVGFNNINIIFNELKTYFDSQNGLSEIVLSGSSAGGYGTLLNTIQLANIFGTTTPTTVIDDSGPIFTNNDILTDCLATQWTNLWLLDSNIPADVDTIVQNTYSFNIQKIYEYLALKYPNFNFGLMSTYEDQVIRGFYSFGKDNCAPIPSTLVTGIEFRNELLDLKQSVLDNHSNWKVFYINGSGHTFLGSPTLNQTVNGTTLNQWIQDLRNGTAVDLID